MFLYKMHLLVYCAVYLFKINCIQISLRLIYLIFQAGILSPQWSSWQSVGLAIQRSRVRSPEEEAPEKGRKKFDAGRFSFMVILNPWVSTLKVWIVFCLGQNFLIKSILTRCVGLFSLIQPRAFSIVAQLPFYLETNSSLIGQFFN